jgi:hypothetical protein
MATISEHCANVEADAGAALLDDGYLRVYGDGPDLLAECRFALPAFGMATCGMAKANRIFGDPNTKAKGKPSRYVALMADGKTVVQEGTIGQPRRDGTNPNVDMVLPTPEIIPHAEFFVTEFYYIRPRK